MDGRTDERTDGRTPISHLAQYLTPMDKVGNGGEGQGAGAQKII